MNQADNQSQAPQETTASPATTEADQVVEVTDLNTFVKLLTRWHGRKVSELEHFLKLPDGQVMQLGDEPEFAVTGDVRKGFLLGINLALMTFGVLPFTTELGDAAPAAAEPTANAG